MESKRVIAKDACKICFTIFLISLLVLPAVLAQDDPEPTVFTPQDQFIIPEYNTSINFASNGSYVYTNLENSTWRFQNLIVDNYVTPNASTWYLRMSALDCNVTITSYCAPYTNEDAWINYTVTGVGTQAIDNNYDRLGRWEISNYTVIIDGTEEAENDGWIVSDDGWLIVTNATSNVTIIYKYVQAGETPPHSGDPVADGIPFGIDTDPPPLTATYALIAAVAIVAVAAAALFAFKRKKQTKII
ncbi:MAG: hypothetical protein IBV52_03200 [Candidatus Bathyarchaeota archaeon]